MIVRYEAWGAWAKLDSPPALVALDRDAVRAMGLDGGAAWTSPPRPSAPLEAHVAVTSRCAAGCTGCYLDARPDGDEPPQETIVARLDALSQHGVFTVAFGGGEPTTRDDLDVLAGEAHARGMTPVLTTSGLGLTPEKIERLRAFAQVNVSYDGESEAYARVRGFDGARHAESAIEALVRAGIPVGVNVVLTRSTWSALDATLDRARALGAREAQLLRYKPAGRAASLDYLAQRLTADQSRALGPRLRAIASRMSPAFRVRIDCALVPFLSADPSIDAATLARFGVLGCEAGDKLVALRVDGKIAPCSFATATSLGARDLDGAENDPEFATWRAWNESPAEPCASCALRSVCRGGCKVVARFVSGAHGPDPECPRVRDHRDAVRRGLRVIRAALAAMTACVVAVALYAIVRALQLVFFAEANPATVIWRAHAGYFWRALIVAYAAGMAALIAWKAAERDPARLARALVPAVVVAAALIFAQGIFLP